MKFNSKKILAFLSIKTSFLVLGAFIFFVVSSCKETNKPILTSKKSIKDYHIECELKDLEEIYSNFKENKYIPIKITYNGETRTARMRIRGDTSRKDQKKSLKIKFDSLLINNVPKTLNLNAEFADKTYIRQYLSSLLMQKSEQICFNAEHAKVYVNGKFYGLYLQVENMDKDFLKRNNLPVNGNLYKATKDGACLSIFDDFNKKWEKKTNKKSDHNDLTTLIKNINSVPDEDFHEFIKNTFEYDKLINMLALNMLLSNSSTYYHNYYLYHDLYNTGKWQMFPWDLDKTLSYYNWMPYTYHRTSSEWESDNPLVERAILCKPMFNDIKKRIDELHKSHLNNISLNPIVDSLVNLLSDIVPLDTTDKIESKKEWSDYANNEKSYFDKHYKLLQQQFSKQPLSFSVFRMDKTQTGPVSFKWRKSEHPDGKKVTYILTYGTDFLLTDSSKTNYISNITDTFYTLKSLLPEGTYYWKVTAFDGNYYTDGFNTKNIFNVKRGTNISSTISSDKTLTKENSPYLFGKTTTIKKGVTLTIESGVEIHLKQDATIECYGNIVSNGLNEEPVVFMPDNTANNWGYIYFYESAEKGFLQNTTLKEGTINCKNTTLTLNHSSILIDKKDMGIANKREVLIYCNKSLININNCTFISNGFGEGLVFFFSDATTENSYFENVPDAIEYIDVDKGIIRNNLVINSPDDAIDLNACNNVLIEKNILLNNIDKAISIGTEQYGASINNIQIKKNLIIGNKTAIAIKDSSIAYISNNTLFKNISGINAYRKRGDYKIGGAAFIKNTIFEKNKKTNAYADEWSSVEVNNSIVNNKVLAGKNNFQGDPKFIDAKGFNFHLKKESPCVNKGDDSRNIGAFGSESTTISFAQVHIKSSKEKNTGDWIELINNYNVAVDLSLYKLVIKTTSNTKEYVFPIGTTIDRLGSCFIVSKYVDFITHYPNITNISSSLPKLSSDKTTIKLLNADGYIIDSYTYSAKNIKKENITFVSNRVNDKHKKAWKMVTD